MDIKGRLFDACHLFLEDKSAIIHKIMEENRKALEQESKSSAGDKHETGRAMLHLEMEKASHQLEVVQQMREILDRINIHSVSERIRLGSLVTTDQGVYFLSISAGQLTDQGKQYFAISPSSPIGSLLIGKVKGDIIALGSKVIRILSID